MPLNRQLGAACTDWQIRPGPADPMTFNDHADWRWDERVLRTLASLDSSFGQLCGRLSRELERFDGYAGRYSAVLTRARARHGRLIEGTEPMRYPI